MSCHEPWFAILAIDDDTEDGPPMDLALLWSFRTRLHIGQRGWTLRESNPSGHERRSSRWGCQPPRKSGKRAAAITGGRVYSLLRGVELIADRAVYGHKGSACSDVHSLAIETGQAESTMTKVAPPRVLPCANSKELKPDNVGDMPNCIFKNPGRTPRFPRFMGHSETKPGRFPRHGCLGSCS